MMRKGVLLGIALSLVVGLLASCGGAKKADLDAANAQVTTLQSQLSAANAAKTTADANKALMRRYYEAVNRGDFDALDEFFAPNYKRYVSTTVAPLNATQQKLRLAGLCLPFPDLKITVDNIIAEGDFVAISLTVRATHQGMFQLIPPTGNPVTVYGFEVVRIENGKMAEHWGGTDTFNILQQIGAVILPMK
jgi:predicted ester cyclase